jgi:hypothetical protein
LWLSLGLADHADSALELIEFAVARAFEQLVQACLKGCGVAGKELAFDQLAKKVLEREKRLHFFGGEPQARQFTALALARIKVVAACIAVPLQRKAKSVAQEREVAQAGGAGDFKMLLQFKQGERALLPKKVLDFVAALCTVHARQTLVVAVVSLGCIAGIKMVVPHV